MSIKFLVLGGGAFWVSGGGGSADFIFIRGRKRHINICHINNFSVTPVTDPPGREPDSSRPGTRTKTFMFLGFRTQHINFWALATGPETPPPPGQETPPPPGQSPEKFVYVYVPFPFLKIGEKFETSDVQNLVNFVPPAIKTLKYSGRISGKCSEIIFGNLV